MPSRRLPELTLMHVVDHSRLAIAILFALIGAAILFLSRGTRGFGQRKQAGALFLVGAVLLTAVAFGLFEVNL